MRDWIKGLLTGIAIICIWTFGAGCYQAEIPSENKLQSGNIFFFDNWSAREIRLFKFTGMTSTAFLILASYYILSIKKQESSTHFLDIENHDLRNENQALRFRLNDNSRLLTHHSLFNQLNAIKHAILHRSKTESAQHLSEFSMYMRTLLANEEQEWVTLNKEIDFIRHFLNIELVRLGHSFEVNWQIDEEIDLEGYASPGLLLYPFVHEALELGIRYKMKEGMLTIGIFKGHNETLDCIIQDNGIGRERVKNIEGSKFSLKGINDLSSPENRIETINRIYYTNIKVKSEDLYDIQRRPLGTRITVNIPYIHENV